MKKGRKASPRKAENALRESEERFRVLLEISPNIILAAGADGQVDYVNPRFEERTGRPATAALGLGWLEVLHPQDLPTATSRWRIARELNIPFVMTFRALTPDGHYRWHLARICPVLAEKGGAALRWLGAWTDIDRLVRAEEALKEKNDALQLLHETATAANEATHLSQALRLVMARMCHQTGWVGGRAYLVAPDGTGDLVQSEDWHAEDDDIAAVVRREHQPRRFRAGVGLPGRVLAGGKPDWGAEADCIRSCGGAEEVRRLQLRTVLALPILAGAEVVGVLEFFSRNAGPPEPGWLDLMAQVGTQLGRVVERQRAAEAAVTAQNELEQRVAARTAALRAANERLQGEMTERLRLEREVLDVAEKERRRIGQTLHDDLGQQLTGIALLTKNLELNLADQQLPEAQVAKKIQVLVNQSIDHARGLAHGLTAGALEQNDLIAALEDLALRVRELFERSCRLSAAGALPPLAATVTQQLYNIAQESVTNALKHGQAALVEIELHLKNNLLTLVIRNDGRPFPQEPGEGMGLRIMRYRADVIGAELTIGRGKNNRTEVRCAMPCPPVAPAARPRVGEST